MKTLNYTGCLIYIFQTFRKINLAACLHKRASKSLLNEWLYFVIPVVFFSGNILIMIINEVLYSNEDLFTYCNDLSNSLCLSFLFFLSYFLSGYFPFKFDEFIRNGINADYFNELSAAFKALKKSKFFLVLIGVVVFVIAFKAGYAFYNVAEVNANVYWIYNLSDFGRVYYSIFLAVTWYHSLSLLGMALSGGFLIYRVVKDKRLIYEEKFFNKNQSILNAIDIVISTFSHGLFYILGAVVIILNDKIAVKYGIYNTFHNDIAAFILIFIILILVIVAYIPLQELMRFLKKQKDYLLLDMDKMISKEKSWDRKHEMIEERNKLLGQKLIVTSVVNKVIVILSVLVPLVGVIFQGIELFVL